MTRTHSFQQVASVPKSSMKVEFVEDTDIIFIESGKQTTSANQSKTLLINGKHKMIMNWGDKFNHTLDTSCEFQDLIIDY